MKTFIASIVTFFVILSSVMIFIFFLNSSVSEFKTTLDEIIVNVENENWTEVKSKCDKLEENWSKKKNIYESFKNHDDTNSINNMILSIKLNISFKEKEEVIMNSHKLKNIFNEIFDDELPTLENII